MAVGRDREQGRDTTTETELLISTLRLLWRFQGWKGIERHGCFDIFEATTADFDGCFVVLGRNRIAHGLRKIDCTGLGGTLHSCGNINAITADIMIIDEDIAEVHTHAVLQN